MKLFTLIASIAFVATILAAAMWETSKLPGHYWILVGDVPVLVEVPTSQPNN
jgi:hypothetical protein